MSSQVNTYVLYGVVLSYDELKAKHEGDGGLYEKVEVYTDNAFKPECNAKDGLTVLYDGMNGAYVAIGHVIAKTDNWQGFGKPLAIPVEHPPKEVRYGLYDLMKELKVAHLYAPNWHVISHYR